MAEHSTIEWTDATCETCRWWDKFRPAPPEIDTLGMCCIRAPNRQYAISTTINGRDVKLELSFPPTHRQNWCGEHERRPDADAI